MKDSHNSRNIEKTNEHMLKDIYNNYNHMITFNLLQLLCMVN
jgi:hypothetical protein